MCSYITIRINNMNQFSAPHTNTHIHKYTRMIMMIIVVVVAAVVVVAIVIVIVVDGGDDAADGGGVIRLIKVTMRTHIHTLLYVLLHVRARTHTHTCCGFC